MVICINQLCFDYFVQIQVDPLQPIPAAAQLSAQVMDLSMGASYTWDVGQVGKRGSSHLPDLQQQLYVLSLWSKNVQLFNCTIARVGLVVCCCGGNNCCKKKKQFFNLFYIISI